MQEFVTEKEHIKNICYVRDLFKLKLENWVEKRKNGKHTEEPEDIMESIIDNIVVLDEDLNTLCDLYSKVSINEDRTNSGRVQISLRPKRHWNLEKQQWEY